MEGVMRSQGIAFAGFRLGVGQQKGENLGAADDFKKGGRKWAK
jgi:hypothetical protein